MTSGSDSEGPGAVLRDATPADAAAVLAINNDCVPAMTPTTLEAVERFVGMCRYFRVLTDGEDGAVIGFLDAMDPTADYHSDNFHWFRERYLEDFLYIDRVAIAASHRGRGLGRHLYRNIERFAHDQGFTRLACEVNTRPRNEASLAFHARLGFEGLEERETDYGNRVLMMEKRLLPPTPGS